jgi:NAD(P)-dependent dehydrogenase (short-subunit alcohol dehydrogenase family)
MTDFGFESTTDEVLDGISLAGKTAVVTGASAGLGIETSRALAVAGATVFMLARDEGKLAAAADSVRAVVANATIETGIVDLADLDSVRACAADLLLRAPAINLLINNAGVMACPLMRTAQGFEMQFGTNHLGHFLLTCQLVPALEAGAPSRVINLSSAGHHASEMNFDDPNYEHREYDKWEAYGQSKTCNALFSVALEARLAERGIHALAVHPGAIQTELSRHMNREDFDLIINNRPSGQQLQLKSIPQGAASSVWAATSPDLEGRGGVYLEDCGIAGPFQPGQEGGVKDYALDSEAADRLWSLSEQLTGEQFRF